MSRLARLDDPRRIARAAGLRYVTDSEPGIRRRRCGKGFSYRDPDGTTIRDPEVRARLNGLAIPPAWTDVWICPDPRGHLQATGRDDRNRKQYVYHPAWRDVRDRRKYARTVLFGEALPRIRERAAADLRKRSLTRDKVLATIIRLLETTTIRVGNDEYARKNGSYGLTTLRDRHVKPDGRALRFEFTGKGGKRHSVELDDPRLARVVLECRDVPGYDLFQYVDEAGERQTVGSGDVNAYIREAAGDDFTAKDFRTWVGTVEAAVELAALDPPASDSAARRELNRACRRVADRLGNTVAVCRDSYIHPSVLESFLAGDLPARMARARRSRSRNGLEGDEAAVLAFLKRHG